MRLNPCTPETFDHRMRQWTYIGSCSTDERGEAGDCRSRGTFQSQRLGIEEHPSPVLRLAFQKAGGLAFDIQGRNAWHGFVSGLQPRFA